MGMGPLPWDAIQSYIQHECMNLEEADRFEYCMYEMDKIFLTEMNKGSK